MQIEMTHTTSHEIYTTVLPDRIKIWHMTFIGEPKEVIIKYLKKYGYMREFEMVFFGDVEYDITWNYLYEPEEAPTSDCPGSSPEIELTGFKIDNIDVQGGSYAAKRLFQHCNAMEDGKLVERLLRHAETALRGKKEMAIEAKIIDSMEYKYYPGV